MWGEEEENWDRQPGEEFYDHSKATNEMQKHLNLNGPTQQVPQSKDGKKLKKKIVYVYESDSDGEGGGGGAYKEETRAPRNHSLPPVDEKPRAGSSRQYVGGMHFNSQKVLKENNEPAFTQS
jgi:hypothetical protein